MNFYPLKFTPIFKERIWGGHKLRDYLNKSFDGNQIGESWELSTVENNISVVEDGEFAGLNLNELIEKFPTEILGSKSIEKYGLEFPLLFKFLDAQQDLSIQVHPNDELAKLRHNSFGKTEMWYVLQADEDSKLVVGFENKIEKEEYLTLIKEKKLVSALNEIPVKKGDTFFLETGTVHAIGAGVLIAEIQQTSDITYRLYDWDRVDANGNERELHTELALDAINFEVSNAQVKYAKIINQSTELVNCPFFKTNILPVSGEYFWKKQNDTFTVLMCTHGEFSLFFDNEGYEFEKGDTILIPAIIEEFELIGNATILEITI
ncbi:type I phosphomannose isomerase catalytic subunit [Flavobacterium urocaniciphilum]|uniref:Phosphohexomutase n=1 Tax=Flavobacterium urocaniciphilum TaxID=1299341 RepID=A0A1H9E6U8_9FLAO|nr:type I phosphomannose isomerase catalytic subunit [Flavobacterium urocaniciphilum]SEQ21355.1 mannose-6-phosphate isomerase, type 1 [Flavobacterium urocaniciphilum]